MRATDHLDDERLRLLFSDACRPGGLFRVADVVRAERVNQGNFSSWKNGNYPGSLASVAAARRFANRFFASHELPRDFARAEQRELGAPTTLDIATWNVKNLGAATPIERKQRIGALLGSFSLVVAQEIRRTDLRAIIDERLFDVAQLEPSGSASRRESLAFVYRRDALELVSSRLLESPRHDFDFRYAPAEAVFRVRATGRRLVVVNVHVSASLDDKSLELDALAALLRAYAADTQLLVAGDFNVEPSHAAFRAWRRDGLRPALECGATTVALEPHCYDALWLRNADESAEWAAARTVSYDDMLDRRSRASRRRFIKDVSDHLPVTMTLDYGARSRSRQTTTDDEC